MNETLEFFHKSHQKVSSGYFVKEPLSYFHNSHHNVPIKEPEPLIQSSLRVCGKIEPHREFFASSLKKACWVHCDHMTGYFLKELSKNSVQVAQVL